MKLRERFAAQRCKIVDYKSTDSNSGRAEYEEHDADGNVLRVGTAAVFNADSVEIDDDGYLTGDSRLSASGEFIVVRKPFDRTGLGRR